MPLSEEITKARMRLFGHCLRMNKDAPAQKAMEYYFDTKPGMKQFRGRPRTTLASVLNQDVKSAAQKNNEFPVKFESIEDLKKMRQFADDRNRWKDYSKIDVI